MTATPLDPYSKAAPRKAKVSPVITLPLGHYAVAGKLFRSRAEAEAVAARLMTD